MSDQVQPVPQQHVWPLQEAPGVESGKRWAGAILCSFGVTILLPLAWRSIFGPPASDPQTALACAAALIVPGVSLFGTTVIQSIGEAFANRPASSSPAGPSVVGR